MGNRVDKFMEEPAKTSEDTLQLQRGDLAHDLPLPENKRFYPALDGFRAVAVLMVFCHHYLNFGDPDPLAWGWVGVDLFFVLSGFLITGILYDTRSTAHRFRNFYVRRSLRIFPLYYAVLFIALLLSPVFHWIWHPVCYLWPFYLSNYARFLWLPEFIQDASITEHLRSALPFQPPLFLFFGHFWSLCVEEQFYLAWPLAVFLIKDRVRLRNLCLAICGLSLIARIACVYLVPRPYLDAELLYRCTPLRADALLLGGALALMLRGPESVRLKQIVQPGLFLFVTGFAAFTVIYRLLTHHWFFPIVISPVLSTIGFTLIDIFAGLVILLALEPGSFLYRAFTFKSLRRLGQMSYGFYVFHDIPHLGYILLLLHTYGPSRYQTILVAGIAFVCTLGLSYLSFRFFETPFLRLKDRFAA